MNGASFNHGTVRFGVQLPDASEVLGAEPQAAWGRAREHDSPTVIVLRSGPAQRPRLLLRVIGPCVPMSHPENVHELVGEDVGHVVDVADGPGGYPHHRAVVQLAGEEGLGDGLEIPAVVDVEDVGAAVGHVGERDPQALLVDRLERLDGALLDEEHDVVRDVGLRKCVEVQTKVDDRAGWEALNRAVLFVEANLFHTRRRGRWYEVITMV